MNRIKRRISFASAVVIGVLLFATAASAQGVLTFERDSHDFGVIDDSEAVLTRFTFANRGDRPLQIKAVRPSCGCTVPHFTEDVVLPGESGVVEVAFNPAGRSGHVRQDVVVIADVDSDKLATQTLVIRAEVTPGGDGSP